MKCPFAPVALVLPLLLSAPARTLAAPPNAAALDRPALMSAKAAKAAMLTTARAGQRMLAAGDRGIVVYSDDSGGSWLQARTPTSASLTAMQFVTDKLGWAVGHMGVVLHTSDGGQTWVKQLDGQQAAALLLADARNRGDERAIADTERLVADGADKPFLDLHFADARNGFIVGAYNLIFRTEDGGLNWTPWQRHVANPKGLHLYGVSAVGRALFIVGEQGLLLRSDNRGDSFAPQPSPYAGSWFGLLATRDSGLLVYGLRGNAFLSTDQGQTWHKAATGTPVSISAAHELADGRIVLASQAGEIVVSSDRGRSFAPSPAKVGLPLTGVAEAPGGLVLASLRGVLRLRLPIH